MFDPMVAPFPWFGGKRRVADEIWKRLGNPPNYVEPFAGSLAVLLKRPGGAGKVETVNDADGLLVNAWRAIAADPDAVTHWADWPVSEAGLHARHLALLAQRDGLSERLMIDPNHYDARLAGWWIWGACCWIGSGWCSGNGPWVAGETGLVKRNAGQGIHRKLPHLGDAGRGIRRQLPHLTNAGPGVIRRFPDFSTRKEGIEAWMRKLSDRLRGVRIACGDWTRVTGPSVTYRHGVTGVLLDPPYPEGFDPDGAYSGQAGSVHDLWRDVTAWAEEMGQRDDMRIAVCGYEGTWTPPSGWAVHSWKAHGGYSCAGSPGEANSNRERVWFSPACIDPSRQVGLF